LRPQVASLAMLKPLDAIALAQSPPVLPATIAFLSVVVPPERAMPPPVVATFSL